MKNYLKMSTTRKPIMTILAAILMVTVLSLSGCASEYSNASKDTSNESSSSNLISSDSLIDSDSKQKEKEVTKEESKIETSSESSEDRNPEGASEEDQVIDTPQSGDAENVTETESSTLDQDCTNETADTQVETYNDPGDISNRLYIPDLGINVGLYMETAFYNADAQQAVVDAEDSAVYLYDFPGRTLIGDHCYQDFATLYNSYMGMPVYIYGQEYVCVENGWGRNNDGTSIIVENGDVRDINDGLTVLYTCASTNDWHDIWYVTVAPV